MGGTKIIGRCTFGIYENKISLWIPVLGVYNTIVVESYEGNPTQRMNWHTARILNNIPASSVFTHQVNCQIVQEA